MSTVTIVLLVILVILIAALIGLYFFGKKAQKKQEEQQAQIEATKIGPKIAIMIADEKVFDLIPLKKEIKAEVSGLYIVGVKGIRGSLQTPAPKKKGFFAKFKKDKTAR